MADDPIPEDAVWFTPAEFKALLADWLESYSDDRIRCSRMLMDAVHGWGGATGG